MEKTIFVTGGAGYLGSIICQKLLEKGYNVKCYDNLYYGRGALDDLEKHKNFKFIKGNTIYIDKHKHELEGCYAVIHLAELANDPSCDLEPEMTQVFNVQASVQLARLAKKMGIPRFVFGSSCSVYGMNDGDILTECSRLNPLTRYAESKVKVESELLKLVDSDFCITLLRQATLFGYSKRMRFDLSLNIMTKHAFVDNRIIVLGGGKQWRPFLHVSDSADAFIKVLESGESLVHGEIFNVGSDHLNYTVLDLAEEVCRSVPGSEIEVTDIGSDRRSYKVNFEKIREVLGYKAKKTLKDGATEILHGFQRGEFGAGEDDINYNIRSLRKMIATPVIEGGEHLRYHFIPFSLPQIGKDEETEVLDTMRSGWLTTGPKTRKFEDMIRGYTGSRYCVALNSCTGALHLSLAAMGIGPGDEVITSPVTWPATANVIVHCGATPVFVDIDKDTFNMDPKKLKSCITKNTKAIIPVHMAGQPCDMDAVDKIAQKHGIRVIEDAAHAIGAEYKGRKIGSISSATCFSFYPIKNITTIEGGAVTTDDEELAEKIRILSLHGVSSDAWKRYSQEGTERHHEVLMAGFKYNMTDIQASMGIHQIKKLDSFIKRRECICEIYNSHFKEVPELVIPGNAGYDVKNARHLYILKLRTDLLDIDRDGFMKAMKGENIGVGLHFRSLHLQRYYKERFGFKREDYPNAAEITDSILSLPLYPRLDDEEVISVAKVVKKLVEYYKK